MSAPRSSPTSSCPRTRKTVERMITGASDLEYTMSFEVLPKIDLDRPEVHLAGEGSRPSPRRTTLRTRSTRLLKANVSYEAKDGAAETGDRLTIDYKGSVDGEPFEGGAGEDAYIVIGSSRFIPGFEEGLVGAKAGEERDVDVTFPEDYQAKHLAGKDAVFDVTVKEVAKPVEAKADDEFARTLGMESFAKLEEAIRGQLQKELDGVTRNKLKKSLLDALDESHSFEMPPSLLDSEFEGIWRNVTRQLEQSKSSFEAQGTTEEKARADYRKLAERRVRLGLVLVRDRQPERDPDRGRRASPRRDGARPPISRPGKGGRRVLSQKPERDERAARAGL